MVLESDGTVVDEDILLQEMPGETFLLLEEFQIWRDKNAASCFTEKERSSFGQILNISNNSGLPENALIPCSNDIVQDEGPSNFNQLILISSAESSWDNFQIPWYKIPINCLTQFSSGTFTNANVRTLIQIIVDEMRTIKIAFPTKAAKIVSKKILERYAGLTDRDEDRTILGDGSASLTNKIIDRNNYLNRPHKNSKRSSSPFALKSAKTKLSNKMGCVNFDHCNETDTAGTYDLERKMINEGASIREIKLKYPHLFNEANIFEHFQKLTLIDINKLDNTIYEKFEIISSYAIKKKYISTENVEKNLIPITIFGILTKHYKEDFQKFCFDIEVRLRNSFNLLLKTINFFYIFTG